jgi:hypothetical protein
VQRGENGSKKKDKPQKRLFSMHAEGLPLRSLGLCSSILLPVPESQLGQLSPCARGIHDIKDLIDPQPNV